MLQKPSRTEGVGRAWDLRAGCKGVVGPGPYTAVALTSPLHMIEAGKSWCSLLAADGPCTRERQRVMKAGSMERFYLKEVLVSK